jgi:hypothetical protein
MFRQSPPQVGWGVGFDGRQERECRLERELPSLSRVPARRGIYSRDQHLDDGQGDDDRHTVVSDEAGGRLSALAIAASRSAVACW